MVVIKSGFTPWTELALTGRDTSMDEVDSSTSLRRMQKLLCSYFRRHVPCAHIAAIRRRNHVKTFVLGSRLRSVLESLESEIS